MRNVRNMFVEKISISLKLEQTVRILGVYRPEQAKSVFSKHFFVLLHQTSLETLRDLLIPFFKGL